MANKRTFTKNKSVNGRSYFLPGARVISMSNRKEEILIAALNLFARDGYEAVSVSQIAGELGMTKGDYTVVIRAKKIFLTVLWSG